MIHTVHCCLALNTVPTLHLPIVFPKPYFRDSVGNGTNFGSDAYCGSVRILTPLLVIFTEAFKNVLNFTTRKLP